MQRTARSKGENGQGVGRELINSPVWLEGGILHKECQRMAGRTRNGQRCVDVRTSIPVENINNLFEPNRGYTWKQHLPKILLKITACSAFYAFSMKEGT